MNHQPNQEVSLQQILFQQIRTKVPENLSFVHEIAELLEISYDSAYRRIRGEKELSMEELFRLGNQFNISLDALMGIKAENVVFQKAELKSGEFNIKNWLLRILEDIKLINTSPSKEIIYAAKDPPIFHYFQFPEIAAFKYFFWEKTIYNFPEYEDTLFRLDNTDSEIVDIGKNILRCSNKIPTTEIWNQDTFRILLRQIEYYWISGYFEKKDDVVNLIDRLEQWLKHIQKEADKGYKFLVDQPEEGIENSFIMYENEVVLNDNTIFVRLGENLATYLTYNVISLLITRDQEFCTRVENHLRGLMRKSNLISSSGLKERNRFFNKLYKTIEKTRLELEI